VIAFAMLGDGDKAGALFAMLNPINHAFTQDAVDRYKVEPYVACADLCSTSPHIGRGGWTWYTGSAGWLYRAGAGVNPGIPQAGNDAADRSVYPERLARLRDHVPSPRLVFRN
jgi:cellobiose phosphorylase